MHTTNTAKELAYIKELTADIVANGGMEGKTIEQALREAHARRQAFCAEMLANETQRAQIARKVLAASVYNDVRSADVLNRTLKACEDIVNN